MEIYPKPDSSMRDRSSWSDAKIKIKERLHIDETEKELEKSPLTANSDKQSAAFNPSCIEDDHESKTGKLPQKVKKLAHAIAHPKSTGKKKTSEELATREEPYLTESDQNHLLETHERLKTVKEDPNQPDDSEYVEGLSEIIRGLEEEHGKKKAAWTSSRYTHRAEVIRPVDGGFPLFSPFRWTDGRNGEVQGHSWNQLYDKSFALIHGADPEKNKTKEEKEAWDELQLIQHFERVVRASSPLQKWIQRLKEVAYWHDPLQTGTYFTIALVIWSVNLVFPFIYAYVLYSTLRRKSRAMNRELMKRDRERANDLDENPHTLGEIIDRHGASEWIQPILAVAGPNLQGFLSDAADWMEVFNNFDEWRTTRADVSAIALIGPVLILCLFTSTEFCVRMGTLGAILAFFLHHPLTVHYPRYSSVILPMHWILWGIPTHNEVSYYYLERQAAKAKRAISEQKTGTLEHSPQLPTSDNGRRDSLMHNNLNNEVSKPAGLDTGIFATGCAWNNTPGYLVVTLQGLHFRRKFPAGETWSCLFTQLRGIEKASNSTRAKTNEQLLRVDLQHGSSEIFSEPKKRDELFNVILAFSGQTWKQVQPVSLSPGKKKKDVFKEKIGL